MPSLLHLARFATLLLFASGGAQAACLIDDAFPPASVLLPTRMEGQAFSFVASDDCMRLRFTIRGTALSKIPTSDGAAGPRRQSYSVVLTESEWNAVAAEIGATLTWVVTGRGAGVTTRLVATNDVDQEAAEVSLSRADAKLVGEEYGDLAGHSVAGAGDTDGDGHDDLLVGAENNGSLGASYLVLGPVTGTLDLSMAHAKLVGGGECVSGAGDVDGDGLSDILIGSSRVDTGAAWLVLGPVSGTFDLAGADAELVGEAGWYGAGGSVSSGGDVDGDGHDDVLIGADPWDAEFAAAYLMLGPVTGSVDLALADAKLWAEKRGVPVGNVAGAGDVDGDGHDDLLIGAPYAHLAGAAYFVRGPIAGSLRLDSADTKLFGEANDDQAGVSVSSAGDTDGDGNDELLIGAPFNDEGGELAGIAYVVRNPVPGTRGLAHADAKLVGREPEVAGGHVAGAGDVDGDGHDDLLIGADQNPERGPSAGAAYLLLGPVTGTVDLSLADMQFLAEGQGQNAGFGVAAAGDVDADDRADLLIGARYNDEGDYAAGAAYLIYGDGL